MGILTFSMQCLSQREHFHGQSPAQILADKCAITLAGFGHGIKSPTVPRHCGDDTESFYDMKDNKLKMPLPASICHKHSRFLHTRQEFPHDWPVQGYMYKNLQRLWGGDWKFDHCLTSCHCLASQGLPSDAEQLSRMTEFSVHIEKPL